MDDGFEEALLNIDVFCSVLVRKMIEDREPRIKPELIENMLRRKYTIEIYGDIRREEPLVDIFEDEKQVKILMQSSCRGQEIKLYPRQNYMEIWVGKGQRINLSIDPQDINKTIVKWNNQVLEITIQK